MTTAVLKNRLLDLTGGTFDEAAYGATTFMDFVLRNEDTLRSSWTVPQLHRWSSCATPRLLRNRPFTSLPHTA